MSPQWSNVTRRRKVKTHQPIRVRLWLGLWWHRPLRPDKMQSLEEGGTRGCKRFRSSFSISLSAKLGRLVFISRICPSRLMTNSSHDNRGILELSFFPHLFVLRATRRPPFHYGQPGDLLCGPLSPWSRWVLGSGSKVLPWRCWTPVLRLSLTAAALDDLMGHVSRAAPFLP